MESVNSSSLLELVMFMMSPGATTCPVALATICSKEDIRAQHDMNRLLNLAMPHHKYLFFTMKAGRATDADTSHGACTSQPSSTA